MHDDWSVLDLGPLSEAWKAELDRRSRELDSRKVEGIDNEEVFVRVRAWLQEGRSGCDR